jgi:hypothetical protein
MNVANKIAETLVSEDPAIVRRAMQTVSRSPVLLNALRRGTETGARVTAHDLGPAGVSSATITLLEKIMAEKEGGDHHRNDIDVLQDQAP